MMHRVQYANSGSVQLAFQVLGKGQQDLMIVPSYVSHLDVTWEEPRYAHFLNALSSFSRVIVFDKRGTGLSSRLAGVPSLEDRMEDITSVMDAVGTRRASLLGGSEGGMIAVLFAATYPERVSNLILYGTTAKFLADDDWPWGMPLSEFDDAQMLMTSTWGTGETAVRVFAPTHVNDAPLREWASKFERNSATPGEFRNYLLSLANLDIRSLLPSVTVPTLVLHRSEDEAVDVRHARYIAAHIPTATLAELPGRDHWWFLGEWERVVKEIEVFVGGTHHADYSRRRLATFLFLDIVRSTDTLQAIGDSHWSVLYDQVMVKVRRAIKGWKGVLVKDIGDGALICFDGPTWAIRGAIDAHNAAASLAVSLRAGMHAGEAEFEEDDVRGLAVNIAARVGALARSGQVLVTRTVKDLVADRGITFAQWATTALKGVEGTWELYEARASTLTQ